MNKHYNKHTKKYRYKYYNSKTKEFNGIKYHTVKMGKEWSGYDKNRIHCDYIKFDYKPYFIYKLIWYFSRKKDLIKSLDTNQKINIIGIFLNIILIIVNIVVLIAQLNKN